ncbi:MAG: PilZ domain-containing protein [Desulfatiglandaceae bacterium]
MTTFPYNRNGSNVTLRLFELMVNIPIHEQKKVVKELEERLFTKNEKRKHIRKPYFMVVDFTALNKNYKDFIKNISTGGVFIATRLPMPIGQRVSMTFTLPTCKKHVKITGEIIRSNGKGIGVKFRLMEQLGGKLNLYCLKNVHDFIHDTRMEVKKLAKVRKKRVRWNASTDTSVSGYKLYWAIDQGVNYDSEFKEIGNVTEVVLPDDIPSFPLVAGDVEIGVTAVNSIGNESDMAASSARFDFTVPDAPTDVVVEDI